MQAIYQPNTKQLRYYLLCAHIYSNSFCTEISNQIDKSTCSIVNKANADLFNRQNGELIVQIPLIGLQNEVIALLQLNRHFPLYATFTHYQLLNNYFFIFFSLGLLLFLFGFVLIYINRPLLALLKAIYHRNEQPLLKLQSRRDEFAQLATLIKLFFQQRRRLLSEVESRKQSEQQLKEAIQHVENSTIEKIKAEKADEAKRVFISNISHELRTPMNAVVAISEMLLTEPSKTEQEKLVKVLGYSAKQLTTLVTDILDFSKIESNSLELIPQSFSLDKMCEDLVQMFTFTAHAKNISVRLQGDDRLRQQIIGDPHRLNQIFINLLGNAVKFTDHGEIILSYKLVQHTADQKVQILFEVKDTGIGISAEDLPHVFERFYQANASPDKKNPGTGLGLSLSSKLVELMGGKLAVESVLGTGTQFFFTLQFQLDKQGPLMSNPEAAFPQTKLSGLNVLVAEDHEINAFVLKQFFAKWEVKATFVGNGQLALEALRKENFDVVLMDLQMPVMDGFQTVQAIRSWPEKRFQNLPVVAVTADASKETRDMLLKNGFDLFISKPFDPAALHHSLQTVRQHRFTSRPDISD
jgi:signal transduction histidine kinase/ActR/RegA family two-component response regulator